MKVKVGTGPDNWGVWFPSDDKQIPWDRYLDEASETGYEWTELGPYGYMPSDPEVLGAELEKRNLKLEAGFVFGNMTDPENFAVLEEETDRAGALTSALGAKFHLLIDIPYTDLFTGEQLRPPRLEEDGWKRFIETNHKLARILRERYDLTAVHHPHAETHVEYEDQIERFLEDTDPDLISICLDTGHHAYRGGDPVAFMRKYHQRVPYLHIKSVDGELQARVEEERIPFAQAVGMDLFVELTQGAVDFPAFVDVLKEVDYEGCAIVEQDMYPCPFDKPGPIARRNREYLREVGIG